MRSSLVLLSLLTGPIQLALAEIKIFQSALPATSKYIQYVTGFLVAPGYVDLSEVRFMANANEPSLDSQNMSSQNDDDEVSDADDELNDIGTATPTASPTATKTSAPSAQPTGEQNNSEETDNSSGGEGTPSSGDNVNVNTTVIDSGTKVITPPPLSGNETTPSSGDHTDTIFAGNKEAKTTENGADGDAGDVTNEDGTDEATGGNDADATAEKGDDYYVSEDEEDTGGDAGGAAGDGDVTNEDGTDEATGDNDADATIEKGDDYYGSEDEEDIGGDAGGATGDGDATAAKGDDYYYDSEDESTDGDGGIRRLSGTESVIDVLFFHEPADCVKTKKGCDWTELGIGVKDILGNVRYCCSEEAVALKLCDNSDFGQIIIDSSYDGVHRPILMPQTGDYVGKVDIPKMETKEGTGTYTLVVSNCYDYGRNILVEGPYEWKSKGGFLPGNLFDEWHFLMFLTVFYCGLLFWYARSMSENRNSVIGIQKWILGTIALAVVELFFRSCDYFEWNKDGIRHNGLLYMWISVGVLKGSISRCLLVMVSLGWGVIRDTLGDSMKKIIMLGVLYGSLAFLRDSAEIWFVEEVQVFSEDEEKKMLYEIYDLFEILTFITAAIDVTFYMWILDSLNSTMQYLENMNQSMKLKRYLRLRLILLFSILFGVAWAIFGIVDVSMDDSILIEGKEWIIRAMWVVNYTFVLVSIALLWKPDPRAKEFAYVMELPSIGDDMVLDTNIGTVDDYDEDGVNVSYSDVEQDGRFTIDDAVPS